MDLGFTMYKVLGGSGGEDWGERTAVMKWRWQVGRRGREQNGVFGDSHSVRNEVSHENK